MYKVLRAVGITTHRRLRMAIRLPALLAGMYAAYAMSVKIQVLDLPAAQRWLVLFALMATLEFVFGDYIADQSFPFDTERKLSVMERRLGRSVIDTMSQRLKGAIEELRGCDRSVVSATVHVIAELSSTADQRVRDGLLQLTEYAGREGGRKGRITLINQGIIGRCARTGKMETVDFADADDYSEGMVRDFGFTRQETEKHSKLGRSYLAFPLRHRDVVVGVLYFFSREPQVFPRAVDPKRLADLASEVVNYLRIAELI